jgi:hypothetical protein
MIELDRTFDPVRLSVIKSILTEAGIDHFVFDTGAGGLWTGAFPFRVMVRDEDVELAQHVMTQAGL